MTCNHQRKRKTCDCCGEERKTHKRVMPGNYWGTEPVSACDECYDEAEEFYGKALSNEEPPSREEFEKRIKGQRSE